MALKAVLESIEGVTEADHYTERDGAFYLQVEATNGLELADTKGLKTALQAERKSASDAKKLLKKFDGIEDPKAALEALAKMEEIGDWDGDQKLVEARKLLEQQFQKKEQKLTETHGSEKKVLGEEVASLTTQLTSHLISAAATKAITDEKGVPELLLPLIRQMTKVVKTDDGSYVAQVLDGDGTVRLGEGTNPMTVAEYVRVLKNDDKYARAFDGEGASGSGSLGPSSRDGTLPFTISEQEATDPLKYRAAKARADKAGRQLELKG